MAVKEEGIHNLSFPKVVVGNIGAALYPRQKPSGMTNAARGFTLIELLVVVLIIGILASVALPQYNKAVRKARLSEVATTFNSISKGIDAWLLENDGYPASDVLLSGNNPNARLDITQSCATEDAHDCYTKVGRWDYSCYSDHCAISLSTSYNADKTTGNKWLDNSSLAWFKHPNGEWGLSGWEIANSAKKEVCSWWADSYGKDRFLGSTGPSSDCNGYF